MTVLKQVQFIKEEDNKIFQLLLRRELCQSRDTCLLQGDFFFFFYFKEIWSGLGGIIFFNVQNIKITTFFKKITKILWKYLPKKQELPLGSPKLHQPATSWSIVVLKAENNKIISKGIFKSDIFVFNKKKLLIYIKATGGNTKIPSEITQIALKCTFQCPQNSFLGKAPSLP